MTPVNISLAAIYRALESGSAVGFTAMNESIRSVLKRRVRWYMALGVGGRLLAALASITP